MSVNLLEKVKVNKLMANAVLTSHILSETTRDESILTYADNGITVLNYSLNISLVACIVKNMKINIF